MPLLCGVGGYVSIMGRLLYVAILCFSLVLATSQVARAEADLAVEERFSRSEKALLLNAAGLAGLGIYGYSIWQYGERSTPHVNSEGGFAADTKHGGVDKLGHAYTGYLIGRSFAGFYRDWGYEAGEAAWMGFGSSMFFTTMMEIGDGFSAFGLAPEDLVANTTGASLGLLMALNPRVGDFIDYRMEYWPGSKGLPRDAMTDYRHMRYHLVFKLSGFEQFKDSLPGFLEFHLGYFALGPWHRVERHLFAGVGVNLARLFEPWRVSRVFNYYQVPNTYLWGSEDF